jgi:SAM-dependent methyltransferase
MAGLDETGLDPGRANDYSNSGGPRLESILKTLQDNSPSGRIVDLGCGKGGAMISLARYFSRVDGLELSERLIPIARENLRRAGPTTRKCFMAMLPNSRTSTSTPIFISATRFRPR